jgi:ABC-type branched-subunit amino acid transport system ATPase component/ABC-type branched-subunit amino acid transport system permease subunit
VRGRWAAQVPALTLLLLFPLIPAVPFDLVNTANLACEYAIAALSIVLLIGLVGQISLCQASFVGVGAFLSALLTRRFGVHMPWTLGVGLAGGAFSAVIIGVVALRVRGLYLAVATLIFAYVCDRYLFIQPGLVESQSGTSITAEVIGKPGTFLSFDLGNARIFYYLALAAAAFALYAVANIRDSRVGRAFAAVRGSEVAAASLGIDVTRYKLLGFACSGALAGLGGTIILIDQRTIAPAQFAFTASLYLLSIAVVGGLRSLGGALASAGLFALLVGEIFYRNHKLADYRDVISVGMLIAVLLFFRGGLGSIPERARPVWRRAAPRLRGLAPPLPRLAVPQVVWHAAVVLRAKVARAPDAATAAEPPDVQALLRKRAASSHAEGAETPDGRPLPFLLSAENITVRFGGLTAVDEAHIKVGSGEIVGLIGPNGAGKTTLFNSLLGLNIPASGRVELFGHDVTGWPVHQRAALGVGRTFQIIQLFSDLTVFENLLVATHVQTRTGLFGSLIVSGGARREDAAARDRVREALRLMDLERFADRRVAGLPFGVLRLIEVARTLVTGARLVCFDEPASGLDSAETERLIEWFQVLRRMGVTLLVIEHDVGMVVRLCDYIYVLDQGHLIAEGRPAQIRNDPSVVASYLGTTLEEAV